MNKPVAWVRPQDIVPREVTATGSESHRTVQLRVDRNDDYFTVPLFDGETVDFWRNLVEELVDGGDCWYDHHGYCQEHSLDDAPCPHARAKQALGG